ncbi:MAG: hypothetical protein D6797_06735, partial [Bdellovibrio sp.]
MDNIEWIKDLVLSEQQMEESGVIDLSTEVDSEQTLMNETVDFLRDLKAAFVEAASAFNQLKGSQIGHVKIYGISKTKADFMLFRNGYKLIFSMKAPGVISISFNLIGKNFIPGNSVDMPRSTEEREVLKAKWGPFGEVYWTYND